MIHLDVATYSKPNTYNTFIDQFQLTQFTWEKIVNR